MKQGMKVFLIVTVLLGLMFSSANAGERAVEFAIFPYLTPDKIIKHHQNLKKFLAKELDHPVSIITARNIKTYIDNVKKGSYQLMFTAPHVGRFAQVRAGYQPVAMTTQYIQGYFVVKKESQIKTLADTKGKTISMAPSFAIIHQIAVQDLKAVGVEMHKDIKHYVTKGHTNAVISLLKGHSDLALSGVSMWKKLEPKYKDQLRILEKSTKIPGFLIMAHADMKPELVDKIRQSLLKFDQSAEGKAYLFKGYKNISDGEMEQLDQYIKNLK